MQHQNIRYCRDHGNGGEILADIVRYVAIEAGIDREISCRGEYQRITVRRGFGAKGHTDVASGAGVIFDHHRLTHVGADPLADDPRKRIGRPARRERNDQSNRLTGVGVRGESELGGQRQGQNQQA